MGKKRPILALRNYAMPPGMISQIVVKGGRFFKAADGSDVQMSESQSRGTGVKLNITSQKK